MLLFTYSFLVNDMLKFIGDVYEIVFNFSLFYPSHWGLN